MGYAGYSPGANSRMPDELTPLQAALRALPLEKALESLELIDKLTKNIMRNPAEAKFRKINLTNEKIKNTITDVPNAVESLREMGWVQEEAFLVLPPTVRFDHSLHVVGIIDAQDYYKTALEKDRVSKMRAAKEVDSETAKLREQLELDRKEKAAEGPVTKGSVAKALPNGGQITAGDLGIGKNSGG
jgi:hypothetical protein